MLLDTVSADVSDVDAVVVADVVDDVVVDDVVDVDDVEVLWHAEHCLVMVVMLG